MVELKFTLESWEDGELVKQELKVFDRWAVHPAHRLQVEMSGVTVDMKQMPQAINANKVGVGACLWEGAVALAAYLAAQPAHKFVGMRCVELGAGVGLVGLLLAKRGAKVVCTDKEVVLPLLATNAELNNLHMLRDSSGWVRVEELEWGAEGYERRVQALGDPPVDLVVAADCCYIDQEAGVSPSTKHFLAAAAGLCGPKSRCLISFELRSSEVKSAFLTEAAIHFSKVVRLADNAVPCECSAEHIELYELRK